MDSKRYRVSLGLKIEELDEATGKTTLDYECPPMVWNGIPYVVVMLIEKNLINILNRLNTFGRTRLNAEELAFLDGSEN